ncbi:hypothetical protein [Priestia flexa]|uniref:hypothetical protein n=1 Tax=Priestia flexa TaxID=86664 RepID=UPI000473112F|nr:hypothetical protein [Priestia flexa]
MNTDNNAKKHYLNVIDQQLDVLMYIMQNENLSSDAQAQLRMVINNTLEIINQAPEDLPMIEDEIIH